MRDETESGRQGGSVEIGWEAEGRNSGREGGGMEREREGGGVCVSFACACVCVCGRMHVCVCFICVRQIRSFECVRLHDVRNSACVHMCIRVCSSM